MESIFENINTPSKNKIKRVYGWQGANGLINSSSFTLKQKIPRKNWVKMSENGLQRKN